MNSTRANCDDSATFQDRPRERALPQLSITSCFCVNNITLRGWALLVSFLFLQLIIPSAQAADALHLFKNYFITGDYVVGGVALRGQGVSSSAIAGGVGSYATGVVHMNGVPQGADIVAAYLYWETISGTSVNQSTLAIGAFRGNRIVGKQLASPGVLACFGSGGGNGGTNGATPLLVFRADVLKYLPFPAAANGQPSGQRLVNDADLLNNGSTLTTVSLPDSGGGGSTSPSTSNQAYLTEGASLVVVYRVANDPLRAIVLYDGGFTFSSNTPSMTQTIQGFYEASKASPAAKMTHIVGNGRNFQEKLYFGGTQLTPLNSSVPNATDPFPGSLGSAWDNLTVNVSPFMTGDEASVSTSVVPSDPSSVACLSWGAIVFSTTVQDTDGDGLLDVWELQGLKDPTSGALLVDLPSMGANFNAKDVFIELDYMQTAGYATTLQGAVAGHSHKPTQGALDMVGDAFKAQALNVHFDIGNNYQTAWVAGCPAPAGSTLCDPYIIPAAHSGGGGEALGEYCASDGSPCVPGAAQFPDYPGTVTWKTGFNFIKNGAPGNVPPLPAHFDHNRKDIFHYVLFAHTLGLPKWWINDKTLTGIVVSGVTATITTGAPHGLNGIVPITVLGATNAALNGNYPNAIVSGPTTITFTTTAPAGIYNNYGLAVSNGVPRSNSGQSDLLGGDVIVTLGRWDDFTGTEFMQASTLMHELGHNLALRHGGTATEPNCKPNYQSIMSYLFQVRGLLDPTGVPHVNYSDRTLPSLNESSLSESAGLGAAALPYLPRWFAPLAGSFLDSQIGTTPAAKHCDGTPLNRDANGSLTEPTTVRIDGVSLPGKPIAGSPIDWNADTVTTTSPLAQDIAFNGVPDNPINGFNDWAHIDLRQIGSRRDPIGYSIDVGPSDDIGAGGGAGNSGDLGSGNSGDLGSGNSGDLGSGNSGDLGSGNSGDLGSGNSGDLGGDLEYDTAETVGNAPNSLSATVVGSGPTISIDLKWKRPTVGKVIQYQVWRAVCPNQTTITAPCSLSPSVKPVDIAPAVAPGATCGPGNAYNFCDGTTKNNTVYLYFVTATIQDPGNLNTPKQSGASNIVAISR